MAQIYAALKMEMGSWLYYSVKMKMSEVASEIKFAYEVNDDKTLDTAIQREIGTSRAGTQIVNYLVQNEHRFFNSLVVAALDGNPSFSAVSFTSSSGFTGNLVLVGAGFQSLGTRATNACGLNECLYANGSANLDAEL